MGLTDDMDIPSEIKKIEEKRNQMKVDVEKSLEKLKD